MHRLLGSTLICAMLVMGHGCGDDGGGSDTGVPDTGPPDTGAGDAGDTGTGDYEPDWSCLGSVTIPPPSGTTASLTGYLRDFTASPSEAGVDLLFCLRDDPECLAPSDMQTTDDLGGFTAVLPTDPDPWWGFGVVAAQGDSARHEYLASTPVSANISSTHLFFLSTGAIRSAATAIETPDLVANGVVIVIAIDCANRFSKGVRFDLVSGSGTTFYGEGDASFTAAGTETGVTGVWGVVNAVPGDFTVAAFVAADDTPIGTVEFTVRAGSVSHAFMNPTPGGTVYSP